MTILCCCCCCAALPSRISRKCSGAYGERYECSYGAHHFVMIGWRQMEKNSSFANPNRESAVSAAFVRAAFAAKPQAKWRWCVWERRSLSA